MSILSDFTTSIKDQEQLAHWLNYFAELCSAAAKDRGFHDDEKEVLEILKKSIYLEDTSYEWAKSAILQAELARQASEIGEAVEAVRRSGPDHHCPQHSNFLIEEADVLIRVADTCGKRQLPLGNAVVDKLLYNLTRPVKHGKGS